jgi:chromosome segregation ATPase
VASFYICFVFSIVFIFALFSQLFLYLLYFLKFVAAIETEISIASKNLSALQQVNAELQRRSTDTQASIKSVVGKLLFDIEEQALVEEQQRARAAFETQLLNFSAQEQTITAEIQGFEARIKEAEARLKEKEKEKLSTKATLAALEIELQSNNQQLASADSETKDRILV